MEVSASASSPPGMGRRGHPKEQNQHCQERNRSLQWPVLRAVLYQVFSGCPFLAHGAVCGATPPNAPQRERSLKPPAEGALGARWAPFTAKTRPSSAGRLTLLREIPDLSSLRGTTRGDALGFILDLLRKSLVPEHSAAYPGVKRLYRSLAVIFITIGQCRERSNERDTLIRERMSKQRRPSLCGNVNRDTTRASLVAFLVAASLFVGGCSGNLSGDFYYTTRGGDVKRLADREIALVKASDQFDSEWRKAVTDFQAAFQVAYESKDTGSQALQDRVVEEWTAHALKLIAWGKVKIVRTDANGHYDMSGLKPGRYYLFARADLPVSMNIRVPFH